MEAEDIISVAENDVCRTCLSQKHQTELYYLFDTTLDNLLWKLTNFLKVFLVEPVSGDGLPSYICNKCVDHLKLASAFKEQCLKSEEKLRNVLHQCKTFDTANEQFNNDLEALNVCSKVKVTDAEIQTETVLFKNWAEPIKTSWPVELLNTNPSKSEIIVTSNTEKIQKENVTKSKLKCTKCRKTFCLSSELNAHAIKHCRNLECEVCGKKFALTKQLNSHIKLHKDYKPFVCKICLKGFTSSGNLSKHMRTHGGEKRHLCITCGRRFYEPHHLVIHKRLHTGEKPIICNVYDKRFSDPHGLIAHNKIHTGERKYECKTCGKRFAHSFGLTAHNRNHIGEKPYQCSICGVSYATSSYLKIHNRSHTQEKPFKCESCSKAFVSRRALVSHNITHTGEKRFQCNVCGKQMARAADLTIHMRTHTGERPYCCNICPKRCHTSSNLSAHKRSHSGIKNYVCTICQKAFSESHTLKCHIRIHTGEKPYVCQICNNRYSQSGQLARHRKTHLNKKNSTELQDTAEINLHSTDHSNIITPITQTIPLLTTTEAKVKKTPKIHVEALKQLFPLLKIHCPNPDVGSNLTLKLKSNLIDSGIEFEEPVTLNSSLNHKNIITVVPNE